MSLEGVLLKILQEVYWIWLISVQAVISIASLEKAMPMEPKNR